MMYYRGRQFPAEFRGALIIGNHGYRSNGHRIVAFRADRTGLPVGDPLTLVDGWEPLAGVRPIGAPVAFAVGRDGALYVTEDRNGTVLRLSYLGKPR